MKLFDAVQKLLHENSIFQELDPQHQETIAGCASLATFQAGEYIYRENQPADMFFLIRHGRVALEVHVPGQTPVVVDTLREGDPLGWSWLLPPYRTQFDARAIELARLIRFDALCLRGKMEQDRNLGYEVHKRVAPIIAQRLAAARRQLLDVYARPDQRRCSS